MQILLDFAYLRRKKLSVSVLNARRMLQLCLEQRVQAICGMNAGQRHRLLRNKYMHLSVIYINVRENRRGKNGQSRETGSICYTRQKTKSNRTKQTQHRKLRRWATRTPLKTGWTQVPAKGNQFLPLMRHPPCYSCSQYLLDTTMRKQTQVK